jgi:hypothetical protein
MSEPLMPSRSVLSSLRALVLLPAALAACCGSVLQGPVHGRVEFSRSEDARNAVVWMRCRGPGLHGDIKTDEETTRVSENGRYTILWSLQFPTTNRCYLDVLHPRYRTTRVDLSDEFLQRVPPIVPVDWYSYLDAGPEYEGANPGTRRPWPETELRRHVLDTGMWLRHFSTAEQQQFAHYVPVIHEIYRRALQRGQMRWPGPPYAGRSGGILDGIARIEERTAYAAPFRELPEAARSGDAVRVRELVEGGVLLEAWDRNHYTPLTLAAREGHVAVLEVLLETGLPAGGTDCGSPLLAALGESQWRAALYLLRAGAHPGASCRNRRTVGDALGQFARNGEFDWLGAFLEAGVPVDVRGSNGTTALAEASRVGRIESVKALLAAGADANTETARGDPILDEAVANGYLDVERALLRGQGRAHE